MNMMIAWLWQGMAIAAATTVAVQLIPRRAASVRHGVWWAALLVVFALPVWLLVEASPGPASIATALEAGTDAAAAPLTLPPPPSWLITAGLALWMLFSVAAVTRLVLSFVTMRRLVRQATPLAAERLARLTQLTLARAGRPVSLKVSSRIRGACAVGFSTPTLLVSNNLEARLDDDQLQAILLHELAHLERRDDWSGLLQQILLAIGGAHLAVWWISRQIDLEREAACDQRVIRRTGAPVMYATSLADAAAASRAGGRARLLLAPGSSTTGSMLKRRVERLLHAPVASMGRVCAGALGSTALLGALAIMVLQAPALVAFAALPTALIEKTESLAALAVREISEVAATPQVTPVMPVPATREGRATPPVPPVPAVAPLETTPSETVVVPIAPVAPQALDGREVPIVPAVPAVLPVLPVAPSIEALPATPIVMAAPPRQRGESGSFATPFVAFGNAVADASVSTGITAARAGKAIGGWFKF